MMARVIGLKCWYADGSQRAIRVQGRNRTQVAADVATLPETGFLVGMVYYDELSQDGSIRYRRALMGNDYYAIWFDDVAPPEFRDWTFVQTNTAADLDRYAGAKRLEGHWTSDDHFKAVTDAAMADYGVSAFGLVPVAGTLDT